VDADKGNEMRGSYRVRYGFAGGSLGLRRGFVFRGSLFVLCKLLGSFGFFLFSGVLFGAIFFFALFGPCAGGLDFAETVGGAVPGAVEADFVAGEGFV